MPPFHLSLIAQLVVLFQANLLPFQQAFMPQKCFLKYSLDPSNTFYRHKPKLLFPCFQGKSNFVGGEGKGQGNRAIRNKQFHPTTCSADCGTQNAPSYVPNRNDVQSLSHRLKRPIQDLKYAPNMRQNMRPPLKVKHLTEMTKPFGFILRAFLSDWAKIALS